jgi:hypothetical protein
VSAECVGDSLQPLTQSIGHLQLFDVRCRHGCSYSLSNPASHSCCVAPTVGVTSTKSYPFRGLEPLAYRVTCFNHRMTAYRNLYWLSSFCSYHRLSEEGNSVSADSITVMTHTDVCIHMLQGTNTSYLDIAIPSTDSATELRDPYPLEDTMLYYRQRL